jgi:hypothetical protein
MSSPALAPIATPYGGLRAETGRLADRLAELVAGLAAQGDETLVEIARFLRTLADDARAVGDAEPVPSPLGRLASTLRLAPVEVDLLLLAGLAEEHEGCASALRRISPIGAPYPTAGLAARLFCLDGDERAELRAILERGAAVRSGVLVLADGGPFFERSLHPGERLWEALHGIDVWPRGVRPRPAIHGTEGLEDWLEEPATARAAEALARRARVTVLVSADSEEIAVGRAIALAEHAHVTAAALDLPPAADGELVRLVGAHALARDCVPLLGLAPAEPPAAAVAPDVGGHPDTIVLCTRPGAAVVDGLRPVLSVPTGPLTPRARRRMWNATLPELADESPLLAARHLVEPTVAAEAAADVRALRALDGGAGTAADVSASIRARAGASLTAGAKLLRPSAKWDALVLRPDSLAQLHESLGRLRNQSRVLDEWGFLEGRPGARGVRMLFAGPPGTGKTLSAEVLAHELEVDLLVVDISRVVSKWIGETEKNLAEVFDAAERAQAVLLFDEADALFGRRTEVSDAHDRYANLETAYLLARLERFEGLAVLATNLRQNVDPAFVRRLEFVVDFEEPSVAEREALWRCHLPARAPLAPDVDLVQLAALYPVVGGVIRNAATAAGFLAAAQGVPISRRHLGLAIRREYEKAGRAYPGDPTDEHHAGRSHG